MENRAERGPEPIPTKEEIVGLLQLEAGEIADLKERSDESGLYRLDVKMKDGTEYLYTRAGKFPGSHESSETDIYRETPTSYPENIWRYEGGAWKEIK